MSMFKTFDNESVKQLRIKKNATTRGHHYQMPMKETMNRYISETKV